MLMENAHPVELLSHLFRLVRPVLSTAALITLSEDAKNVPAAIASLTMAVSFLIAWSQEAGFACNAIQTMFSDRTGAVSTKTSSAIRWTRKEPVFNVWTATTTAESSRNARKDLQDAPTMTTTPAFPAENHSLLAIIDA